MKLILIISYFRSSPAPQDFNVSILAFFNQLKRGLNYFTIISLVGFFLCSAILNAQENENQPSVTSTQYQVKPGDTKYSLAKHFGITIAELERQNPQIVPVLQAGQILTIGEVETTSVSDSIQKYYSVKSGDTKFSLAKRHGLSISELENLNPHIVPILQVGQKLRFTKPTNHEIAQSEESFLEVDEVISKEVASGNTRTEANATVLNPSDGKTDIGKFKLHKVQAGETLFGLSKQAGMSMDDFKKLNPQLGIGVQIGMVIKMPSQELTQAERTSLIESSRPTIVKTPLLSQTVDRSLKRKVAFFLPFPIEELKTGNQMVSDRNLLQNKEFFKGAMIAMDSAKSLGLDFNFEIVNTGVNPSPVSMGKKAKEIKNHNVDAVIIPRYENGIMEVASALDKDNIPVISLTLPMEKTHVGNLYEFHPSVTSEREVVMSYISSMPGTNVIVISDRGRNESRDEISSFFKDSKILIVGERGGQNPEDLKALLKKGMKNVVILDTERDAVFISATNVLLREIPEYSIDLAVLESSLIPDEDDVSKKRFVVLNMIFPGSAQVKKKAVAPIFRKSYVSNFSGEPSIAAEEGFRLTFDTLLRLFQKSGFINSLDQHSEYNSLRVDYKKNKSGYYSNFAVDVFRYESDGKLIQVK